MNKYKLIQIICWSVVFVVFVGLAIWFASKIALRGTINNYRFNIQSLSGPYEEQGRYNINSSDVKNIDVDWVSGNVKVIPYDGNDITLVEYAQRSLESDELMEYGVSLGGLKVKFRANNNKAFDNMPSKKLEVFIPLELAGDLKEFEINTVSAPVDVKDISSKIFEITTVSGACEVDNINSDKITLNTTSGNIRIKDSNAKDIASYSVSGRASIDGVRGDNLQISTTSGNVNISDLLSGLFSYDTVSGELNFDGESERIDVKSTSGRIKILDRIVPEELYIVTVSGDINVSIPKSEYLSIKYNTVSGKFSCDFPILLNESDSIYNLSTGSGDITIEELKN